MIPSLSSDVGKLGLLSWFVSLMSVSLVVLVVSKSISMLSSASSSTAVSTPPLRQLGGIDLLFFVGGFIVDLLSVVAR